MQKGVLAAALLSSDVLIYLILASFANTGCGIGEYERVCTMFHPFVGIFVLAGNVLFLSILIWKDWEEKGLL